MTNPTPPPVPGNTYKHLRVAMHSLAFHNALNPLGSPFNDERSAALEYLRTLAPDDGPAASACEVDTPSPQRGLTEDEFVAIEEGIAALDEKAAGMFVNATEDRHRLYARELRKSARLLQRLAATLRRMAEGE